MSEHEMALWKERRTLVPSMFLTMPGAVETVTHRTSICVAYNYHEEVVGAAEHKSPIVSLNCRLLQFALSHACPREVSTRIRVWYADTFAALYSETPRTSRHGRRGKYSCSRVNMFSEAQ